VRYRVKDGAVWLQAEIADVQSLKVWAHLAGSLALVDCKNYRIS